MQFSKTFAAAAVCGLFAIGNAQASGISPPRDLVKLFGNLVQDQADANQPNAPDHDGYEVAMPFINIFVANQGDTYPSKVSLMYKTYAVETGALIRTSQPIVLTIANGGLPAIPAGCNAQNTELDGDFLVRRREDEWANVNGTAVLAPGSQRAHIAFNLESYCTNGFNRTAVVYSGNISGRTGPTGGGPLGSWLKTFPNKEIIGINGFDATGDMLSDGLMITVLSDVTSGENVAVLFVKGSDGTTYNDGTNDWVTRGYAWTRYNVENN